jgi:small GTP-binding protein
MAWLPRKTGWLLLVYLAVIGYALVAWLPRVVAGYRSLAETHAWLGYAYLTLIAIGGSILLGLTVWVLGKLWRNSAAKRRAQLRRGRNPSELSAAERAAELQHNLQASEALADATETSAELKAELVRQLRELQAKQQSQQLQIVAFGTISSGKSSLLNALAGRDAFETDVVGGTTTTRCEVPWPGDDRVVLVDTPGLAEVRGEDRAASAAAAAKNADLVLLVVDGPLKAYEVELVKVLHGMEKRLLVCLNKEDWYDPPQQKLLLGQIAEQLPQVDPANLTAVRSVSVMRPRVRVLGDGTEVEEEVEEPPDVSALADRMLQVVRHDGRDLLLANLLLQSRGMVDEAKNRVRAALDRRADQIITRYMWAAGGAAGINPFPLLDLAGGSAITLKMTLELARVYRQPLDADMAAELLQQLSKNLVAMVGTVAATPALASLIGSLLKTVPGVGSLAGGLLQGLVQALVTRWIGNVFVEYLRNEMRPPRAGLAETARRHWQRLTTADALRGLIRQGRGQLDSSEDPVAGILNERHEHPQERR